MLSACANLAPISGTKLAPLDVEELPPAFLARPKTASQLALTNAISTVLPWLNSFESDLLNQHVETAINNNYALAQQASIVKIAEESVALSSAGLLPTLNIALNSQQSGSGVTKTSQYGLSLSATYEVDLWGKLSISQKRARIELGSQRAKYRDSEQRLVANVVNASFDSISASQLLAVLRKRLENITTSLDVIQKGYRSGINSALDVYLSRNTLELVKAEIANQRQVQFEARTRLALLLGEYPDGTLTTNSDPINLPLKTTDIGIPAGILGRRPDIEAAWLNLLVADAGLAIAHRNRFPSINLSASVSDSKTEFDQLLDGGSLAWTAVTSLVQPLFQGGRLAALENQAKILLDQREKRYLEVVFRAFAEVENELNREQTLKQRYEAFVQAEENATAALDLAVDQYQRGIVSYTTVLESQRRAFDAQTTLIQLQNQHRLLIQGREIRILKRLSIDY